MKYQAELDFLMKTLEKMNLQTMLLTPQTLRGKWPDLGLRKFLGMEHLYEQALLSVSGKLQLRTISKITDEFYCTYFALRLPDTADVHLVIGPYVPCSLSREQLLEKVERYNLSAGRFAQFERCFSGIPILKDDTAVFALLSAFGETLWGRGSAFEFTDVTMDLPFPGHQSIADDAAPDPEDIALQMRAMEKRYGYENELMEYVSHGLTSRADRMVRAFPGAALDQRTSDPVRNMKNYCIVCNTLMRKAAEKGGVHPLLLDKTSASLARQLEQITNLDSGMELMREMIRAYCRLVRKHAVGRYPPLVQKTLTYIDANLAGDLKLQTLAQMQSVSGSYLSALFHKETGKTLTECIAEKRVEAAAGLLLTTHLQVQTVAQHCGFSDVNYFSKAFKKYYGVTPRQYRENRPAPLRTP